MKKLGTKRKVTLPGITSDSFTFSLSFAGDHKPCCLKDDKYATYVVSGLDAVTARYGESGKVALHFDLDSNGILTFLHADSTVNIEETIQVDKMVPDEDAGVPVLQRSLSSCVQSTVLIRLFSQSTFVAVMVAYTCMAQGPGVKYRADHGVSHVPVDRNS